MKKNLLKLTFVLSLLLLTLIPLSVNAAISGNGTEESPFMITNEEELQLVTDFPDCHFKLANDIVMTKELETPLCYESENQTFTGVFDGNGYTISDVIMEISDYSSYATFINKNEGTIKNVNIKNANYLGNGGHGITYQNSGIIDNCSISFKSCGGPSSSAGIAHDNSGTISKCHISGSMFYFNGICRNNTGTISECEISASISVSTGGIAEQNYGTIEKCSFSGSVNDASDFGGISGSNSGLISKCKVLGDFSYEYSDVAGICCNNYSVIENCFYSGTLSAETVGGISINNYTRTSSAKIENCYVAASFNYTDKIYAIAKTNSDGNIINCYYDRTLSGINDNTQGTPMSTVAMKMAQTYSNWDFDTVWGIDENINDGYPYLLWEYPVTEKENPYTINSLTITDLSGNTLSEIPDNNFYLEIDVTKNDNSPNADSLIIAVYDENDTFLNLSFMKATYTQNQSITFGTMINKHDKKIGSIKAFVWDSLFTAKPLSNAMEIN